MFFSPHIFFGQRFRAIARFAQIASKFDIFDFIVIIGIFFFLPFHIYSVFSLNDLLLLFFAFVIIPIGSRQCKCFYFAKEHILILFFALWAFVMYMLHSSNEGGAFICWSMYLMPCILFLSFSQLIYYEKSESALEKGWIIWGLLLAIQLLYSIYFSQMYLLDLHYKANLSWARSNYIAAMLETPIIWCYHRIHQKNTKRTAAFIAFIICTVALFLTVSRGGILTIVLSLLMYSLLKRKLSFLFYFAILVAYFFPRISSRFLEFFDTGNVSRMYLWLQSAELLLKKPVLGYGPGDVNLYENIFTTTEMATDPHNFILTILLHTGVIGFIIFAALVVMFCHRALILYKKKRNPFFIVVLFAAFFHGMGEPTFLGYSYSFIFWYSMVMLLIQSEHAKREHHGGPMQKMDGLHS